MIQPITVSETESSEHFIMKYYAKIIHAEGSVGFNIMHVVVNPLCATERDQHQVKECWYITQGKGQLTLNDVEIIPVEKGQLYFFESMVSHQLYNDSPDVNLELLSIWW